MLEPSERVSDVPGASPEAAALTCGACGGHVAARLLACPSCHRLVHGVRLEELASAARSAESAGDVAGALSSWREALGLLPAGTRQHSVVSSRVAELSRALDERPGSRAAPARRLGGQAAKAAAGVGAVGLLAWKLKGVLALVLTKGKLLLAGLTKSSTLFTMLASVGVYWAAFGWKLAVGLVASIYVHEMGHVAELKRRGFPASAPTFIPGIGALVRLNMHPATPEEDARIGLAGPTWGLGAAVACWLAHLVTGDPLLAALAQLGAWINLFNLLPVWQLDGSRGFAAMTRAQRALSAAVLAACWLWTREGLLLLLLVVAVVRVVKGPFNERPDRIALAQYAALTVTLSALCLVPVPLPPR